MSRAVLLAAALAVLALAVDLRFTGLGYILPSLVEPDAHIVVQTKLIESDDPHPEENISWGKYPHVAAWTTVALMPEPEWGSLEIAAPLAEHLELAEAATVRVRRAIALLSLLALPATWLIARLYVPRGWRLVAVAFMATSLIAVHFSGQARPHGAAVAWPALAVAACVRLRRDPSWASYGLASGACALALGSLQSGIAAYIPLGVAHLLASRGRGLRAHWKLLPAIGCFALAIALFYPFWLAGSESGRVEIEGDVLDQSGHKINLDGFDGRGFPILVRALWSWEPALAAGLLLALAMWVARRARSKRSASGLARADHLVVLSYVLSYGFVIGLYMRSYERFLLPLVPFFAVLTSYGLWQLGSLSAKPAWRVATSVVAAAWLSFPAYVGLKLDRLRQAPSTFDLAARWVESQVEPGETVLVNVPLILPLYHSPPSLAADDSLRIGKRGLMWIQYQREVLRDQRGAPAFDVAWIPIHKKSTRESLLERPEEFSSALVGDYALIEVFGEGRIDPAGSALRAILSEHGERLARFSPDSDPEAWDAPLIYQDETGGRVPPMALRLLAAERLGPVLEAYRLPAAGARESESDGR